MPDVTVDLVPVTVICLIAAIVHGARHDLGS